MGVFRPSYKTVKPSSITVKNLVDRETALDDGVVDVEYRGDNDGALKGTMVHRLMEVLVSSKNCVDGSKLVKEIINEYDDSSKREYHESLLKDVLITIRSGGYEQKYGAPKDILKEL